MMIEISGKWSNWPEYLHFEKKLLPDIFMPCYRKVFSMNPIFPIINANPIIPN